MFMFQNKYKSLNKYDSLKMLHTCYCVQTVPSRWDYNYAYYVVVHGYCSCKVTPGYGSIRLTLTLFVSKFNQGPVVARD